MTRVASVIRFAFVLALLSCMWGLGTESAQSFARSKSTIGLAPQSSDSLLLDQYPDAYAAYSLRKLRSDYSGPCVRVRRMSDDAEKDFGFDSDGWVDVSAIESWLGSADGRVVRLYAQVAGTPDLVEDYYSASPLIAGGGIVETDEAGHPTIRFENSTQKLLTTDTTFDTTINANDYTVMAVLHYPTHDGFTNGFGLGPDVGDMQFWFGQTIVNGANDVRLGDEADLGFDQRGLWTVANDGSRATLWRSNKIGATTTDSGLSDSHVFDQVNVGGGFTGTFGEFVVYSEGKSDNVIEDIYRNVTTDWDVGPKDWNENALLPQNRDHQVTLYNWLETITESDVTLPSGSISYDNSYADNDELADLWLQTEHLTASAVTRSEPGWYVLDNGNGKGIEATGDVRIPDEPGSGYSDIARSWENEPAFLYQLDLPTDGGQGNDWYQERALGLRAMIVAIVDMMMHHEGMFGGGASGWYDMKGKAMLGMAEAYRWTKQELPSNVQNAFEQGFRDLLDDQIERGPRAVNTNMGMFAVQAYADMYMAANEQATKTKCVEAAKAALFGFTDGELETNHEVFTENGENGVFSPAGPILEGGQPDVFYMGESLYHLTGALQAVTDRSTGAVDSEWTWLKEVVRRAQDWRTYQKFYDPKTNSPAIGGLGGPVITAGAGFSGRTSYGVPHGQAGEHWKSFSIADRFDDFAYKGNDLKDPSTIETELSNNLSVVDEDMNNTYTGQPDVWSGWSPWTKATPYLPPEGWYSRLKDLDQNNDPKFERYPALRNGNTWNKTFGGPPTGKNWWSYLGTDTNGDRFGFFVEAMDQQGGYGGWYGGKIETFWTEETGVLLINRHGKTGCDDGSEDSECFDNIDKKAGHHVWGRDENGKGFTTLLLRGRELSRTTTFDTNGSPPTVEVNNVFNDPSHTSGQGETGEETGSELEGSVEVKNTFEVVGDGLKVTHALDTDGTDEVNELWASLPVYLRHHNPLRGGDELQSNIQDTRIEYWDGSSWVVMPDSTASPAMVSTTALRLGRDYEDGQGMRYGYVSFKSTQDVRLSNGKYYDPYQSMTGVRTVHIDLHGDPDTTKAIPTSKSVSYTVQTTDPTSEGEGSASQVIPLQKGWNLTSTFISPATPAMDSIFAGLQSEITVVKNEQGDRYQPSENVDEIGQWNSEKTYAVHAKSDAVLTVEGDSLGAPSITLEQGWNWVPYFPTSPLSVQEAISSIIEDVGRVKDETGRVYLPEKDPDILEQMEPGEGYKVYVHQPTTLAYPDSGN